MVDSFFYIHDTDGMFGIGSMERCPLGECILNFFQALRRDTGTIVPNLDPKFISLKVSGNPDVVWWNPIAEPMIETVFYQRLKT